MTTPQTTTTTMLWHSLSYRDAPAAIEFLTSAFGFVAKAVYTDETDPSRVVHAQLDWPPGGGVMLGSVRRGEGAEGWVDACGHGQCYCVTHTDADVDGVYARAMEAGATPVREPEEMPYGGRGCTVRDPEGNQWSFGSYRGE